MGTVNGVTVPISFVFFHQRKPGHKNNWGLKMGTGNIFCFKKWCLSPFNLGRSIERPYGNISNNQKYFQRPIKTNLSLYNSKVLKSFVRKPAPLKGETHNVKNRMFLL